MTSTPTEDDEGSDAWGGFWPDLLLTALAGIISALIAIYVARRGDRKMETRWREEQTAVDAQRAEDRALEQGRREAEWIREAATELLRAAQEWRASLGLGSRAVFDARGRWRHATEEIEARTTELSSAQAALSAALERERDYFDQHGAHLQRLQGEVNTAQTQVAKLEHEIQSLHEEVDTLERTIEDTVDERANDAHTRWIQAKALSEVLAPTLHGALDDVERALQVLQTDIAIPSTSPGKAWSEADQAFARMLGVARRDVESLLDYPTNDAAE